MCALGRWGDDDDNEGEHALTVVGALQLVEAARELTQIRKILEAVFAKE
jgi:hypothetical protein